MMGNRVRFHPSHVALMAAAVVLSITVQYFAPEASMWDPDRIVVAWYGSEITDNENNIFCRSSHAQEAYDTLLGVIAIDPPEARSLTIAFMKGWLTTVESVQIRDPSLQLGMRGILQQVP